MPAARTSTTARTRCTAWSSAGASCGLSPPARAGASARRQADRVAGLVARARDARKAERLGLASRLHHPDAPRLLAARGVDDRTRDVLRTEERKTGCAETGAAVLAQQRRVDEAGRDGSDSDAARRQLRRHAA